MRGVAIKWRREDLSWRARRRTSIEFSESVDMATPQDKVLLGPVAVNGFPARRLAKSNSYEGGEWVTAYQAEQRTRLRVVFMNQDHHQQRRRRGRSDQSWTHLSPPANTREASGVAKHVLNREFLMKHCFVRRPTDLSHADISGIHHKTYKSEDFKEFDSLVHIDASDSALPMEIFKMFPVLEHLDLCVCGIEDISVTHSDFTKLLHLDLSYNSVSSQSLLTLGTLPQLRELHLTGNDLVALPVELSRPFKAKRESAETIETGSSLGMRFAVLETLWLDNNKLCDQTTFSTLAGLRRLKYVNLDNNELYSIPQLRLIGTSHLRSDNTSAPHHTPHVQTSARSQMTSSYLSSSSKRCRTRSDERMTGPVTQPRVTKRVEELVVGERRSSIEESNSGVAEENNRSDGARREDGETAEEEHGRASIAVAETDRPMSISQLPPSMAPFPHLHTLSLANNLFFSSEGLQACGLWPAMKELILYGNPVISKCNGMPPRLHIELCQERNIRVIRHKPKAEHFHIGQSAKGFIKIPTTELETRLSLPPIGKIPLPLPPPPQSTSSPTHSPPNTTSRQEPDEENRESIFITQGMGEHEDASKLAEDSRRDSRREESSREERSREKSSTTQVPEQYRGYEALFEEDSPHLPLPPVPSDIHGCINALRHTLKNGSIYKQQQQHYNPHRMVKRQLVLAVPPDTHSKVRDMQTALNEIRTSAATLQTNLASLLDMDTTKDKKMHQLQKEGKLLLKQLQSKYADAQRENENQTIIKD